MFSTNGMGSTVRGSIRSERSHTKVKHSNAVFDPHILADEKKIMQESQNLGSVEDARQKMLDIFVKQISPRHHILNYSEQFT
mgnify:CR=1 FL=1